MQQFIVFAMEAILWCQMSTSDTHQYNYRKLTIKQSFQNKNSRMLPSDCTLIPNNYT
jgi:hypothetical protein